MTWNTPKVFKQIRDNPVRCAYAHKTDRVQARLTTKNLTGYKSEHLH